jgi:signal peptidase I
METREFEAPATDDARGDARLGEAFASLVREGLRQHGRVNLRLLGNSMWPSVPAGSLVAVEEIPPGGIRLGDVIVWQRGGQVVAHRVVQRVRKNSTILLVTKGDNNASADQKLEQSALLGRVAAVYRQSETAKQQSNGSAALEAVFWVSRWRLSRLAGSVGNLLPVGLGRPLVRVRDRLGRCLSLAYKLTLLRF